MNFLRTSYDREVEHFSAVEFRSWFKVTLIHAFFAAIFLAVSFAVSDTLPVVWFILYVSINQFERDQMKRMHRAPNFSGYVAMLSIFTLRMLIFRAFILYIWFHPSGAMMFPALIIAFCAILYSINQGWELRSYSLIQAIGDSVLLLIIALSFFLTSPLNVASILAGVSILGLMAYHALVLSELIQFKNANYEFEKRSRQSQKMEAIGHLTGGIAHDFNNILTVVIGNLELYREVDTPQERDSYAQMAHDAAKRASHLTAQLLKFSRQSPAHCEPLDVTPVLENFAQMARRVLPSSIQLSTSFPPDLPLALADQNQLENALLNLTINARDAMAGGGMLDISAQNLTIQSDERTQIGLRLIAGEYIAISVTDTGEGIAADQIYAVFEPFFTTKPAGKGSGLGLSAVKGFAEQCGGGVTLDSVEGKGTTVSILVPVSNALA